MSSNSSFFYAYSAEDNQEVLKIPKKYMPKEKSELEELKELDAKVKRPANVFAYVYGSLGAIIMGAGMSLVMTEIGDILGLADTMLPGIAIGIVGMVLALSTYPIYKKILAKRQRKYANQIMELSEKVLKK
jgi:hypothetical protein